MPRVEAKGKFVIPRVNMERELKGEIQRFARLYNEFKEWNAIYPRMTVLEIEALAADMNKAIKPDIVFFAEVDGVPIGPLARHT